MRLQQALPWVNPRRLAHRACKSVQLPSVGPVTLFTTCSIAHASQLKIRLKVTFGRLALSYQHKICHPLTKFGARKLIWLQFIASTNVAIQQIAIIANHGNVKYNANDMMLSKM
jgi:hypothetical protein